MTTNDLKKLQDENEELKELVKRYENCNGRYDLTMLHQALHDEKCKREFTDYQI